MSEFTRAEVFPQAEGFTKTPGWLDWYPGPAKPRFQLPAGAVDAHCHVFGPGAEFPYAPERKYTPCDASKHELFALRGKLQMAQHLRANLVRRDRFFTEFDEFSPNRPENRLLHAALRRVLDWTSQHAHQQLARELCFVFADVPASQNPTVDFQRVRQDRGMAHYDATLAWTRLILQGVSPLTGSGAHHATSLLFPMERVFEAFVAKHLPRQLAQGFSLRTQVSGKSLVQHQGQDWFRLKPDLLVQEAKTAHLVLDTKWKLLNSQLHSGADKYGLGQGDFYQLYAYGQHYLGGQGDLVLIYPKTDTFAQPLAVFEFLPFTDPSKLRLWVLPFCLELKQLLLPQCAQSKQILQFLN